MFASTRQFARGAVMATSALVGAGAAVAANRALMSDDDVAHASDALHAPQLPWGFSSVFKGYDMASVRRGHQVFTEVCESCHSLERLAFRNLVDNCFTEAEAKRIAANYEVADEPDENGEPRTRQAKLSDYWPNPYANEQEARAANEGALPPDLSLITKARHGGPDYIFALLTGYRNEPAGVETPEGLYYNPYFPGGGIAMPQKLFEDAVEYDDGAPQTPSQYAKDVSEFLAWVAEPEAEERKRMGIKFLVVCALMAVPSLYMKRFKYNPLKSRVVKFIEPKDLKK